MAGGPEEVAELQQQEGQKPEVLDAVRGEQNQLGLLSERSLCLMKWV